MIKKTITLAMAAALFAGASLFAQPANAQGFLGYGNNYGYANGMNGMFGGCHRHHHHHWAQGLMGNNYGYNYNSNVGYNPYMGNGYGLNTFAGGYNPYANGAYNNGYGGYGYGAPSVFGRLLNRF